MSIAGTTSTNGSRKHATEESQRGLQRALSQPRRDRLRPHSSSSSGSSAEPPPPPLKLWAGYNPQTETCEGNFLSDMADVDVAQGTPIASVIFFFRAAYWAHCCREVHELGTRRLRPHQLEVGIPHYVIDLPAMPKRLVVDDAHHIPWTMEDHMQQLTEEHGKPDYWTSTSCTSKLTWGPTTALLHVTRLFADVADLPPGGCQQQHEGPWPTSSFHVA